MLDNVEQSSFPIFQVTVKGVRTLKTEYIGFRVPQQDKEALARFAQDNATTTSQVIRYLLKQLLKGEYHNGIQSIPNQSTDATAST
jgi:hypothetical protein